MNNNEGDGGDGEDDDEDDEEDDEEDDDNRRGLRGQWQPLEPHVMVDTERRGTVLDFLSFGG